MPIVTGIVEAMTDKYGKVNCLLDDGKWYSTKPEYAPSPMPKKGDQIEFDSGPTGKYFSKVKILGGGGTSSAPTSVGKPVNREITSNTSRTFPVGPLAPERTINRQNALTNAVAFYGTTGDCPEDIIAIARKFEAYTTGDLDLEEAKKALKELEG